MNEWVSEIKYGLIKRSIGIDDKQLINELINEWTNKWLKLGKQY